jgi:hypothetical protein
MLITAILVAESEIQSYTLTKTALAALLEIAAAEVDVAGLEGELAKWDLPQVHTQNTMRSIFTEARLASISFGFVESGFAVSIKGFSADM